ncbi:uncharacterized protein LOC142341522 isoform X2 [Convolutriloba macropyga]|uniref:uncharacterized protein LOC142341522 isoform X2 n=1 Tax=Convolutriloba macropyga TaxID=536237 RepID=UPI003F5284B5
MRPNQHAHPHSGTSTITRVKNENSALRAYQRRTSTLHVRSTLLIAMYTLVLSGFIPILTIAEAYSVIYHSDGMPTADKDPNGNAEDSSSFRQPNSGSIELTSFRSSIGYQDRGAFSPPDSSRLKYRSGRIRHDLQKASSQLRISEEGSDSLLSSSDYDYQIGDGGVQMTWSNAILGALFGCSMFFLAFILIITALASIRAIDYYVFGRKDIRKELLSGDEDSGGDGGPIWKCMNAWKPNEKMGQGQPSPKPQMWKSQMFHVQLQKKFISKSRR